MVAMVDRKEVTVDLKAVMVDMVHHQVHNQGTVDLKVSMVHQKGHTRMETHLLLLLINLKVNMVVVLNQFMGGVLSQAMVGALPMLEVHHHQLVWLVSVIQCIKMQEMKSRVFSLD
jgi:hypothetical protein